MDRKLGPLKAASRRESGLLPSRPDRATGKTEDPFKEYGTPKDWEQITWEDMKKMLREYELETDKDTVEALNDFRSGAGSSNDHVPDKTETEKMAEKIETVKAHLPAEIAKLQAMVLNAKLVKTRADASGSKYHEALIADCAKLISQGEKLVKLLERMVLEPTNDKEMPKVISQLDDVQRKNEIVSKWASTYGLAPEVGPDSSSKKRRKAKQPDM
eukprot:8261989-Pyramimonas_sp.AAC.1